MKFEKKMDSTFLYLYRNDLIIFLNEIKKKRKKNKIYYFTFHIFIATLSISHCVYGIFIFFIFEKGIRFMSNIFLNVPV